MSSGALFSLLAYVGSSPGEATNFDFKKVVNLQPVILRPHSSRDRIGVS